MHIGLRYRERLVIINNIMKPTNLITLEEVSTMFIFESGPQLNILIRTTDCFLGKCNDYWCHLCSIKYQTKIFNISPSWWDCSAWRGKGSGKSYEDYMEVRPA